MNNDTLLAIPFFTFMGLVLERSGMAEDLLDTIGQLFGTDPGRPRLRGRLRRRAARGHHRRGGGLRDLDGPDLAADHAALRLRPPDGDRHHRGFRHAGADHSAVAGADRDGRPARQVGRRHVRGRLHSRTWCSPASMPDTPSGLADISEGRSGPAAGGDRLSRRMAAADCSRLACCSSPAASSAGS